MEINLPTPNPGEKGKSNRDYLLGLWQVGWAGKWQGVAVFRGCDDNFVLAFWACLIGLCNA